MVHSFVDFILPLYVPEVAFFVPSASQQVVNIAQLYCYFGVAVQIMGLVDLAKASLPDQSQGLIPLAYQRPLLFGQKADIFLLPQALLFLHLQDLKLQPADGLFHLSQLFEEKVELHGASIVGLDESFQVVHFFLLLCKGVEPIVEDGTVVLGGDPVDLGHSFELFDDGSPDHRHHLLVLLLLGSDPQLDLFLPALEDLVFLPGQLRLCCNWGLLRLRSYLNLAEIVGQGPVFVLLLALREWGVLAAGLGGLPLLLWLL